MLLQASKRHNHRNLFNAGSFYRGDFVYGERGLKLGGYKHVFVGGGGGLITDEVPLIVFIYLQCSMTMISLT